jgi:glycerophosphoryl diester phosphodiesterase
VQLLGENGAESTTDYVRLRTPQGLDEVARVADGIGPSLTHVVIGSRGAPLSTSALVKDAHARGLAVHAYTFRADALPPYAGSLEELLRIFVVEVGVDGVFTDQADRAVAFMRTLH